jgi:Protein of unknown function (DUF2505)
VRFHAEHSFAAPAAAVLGVLTDPAFYLGLTLPDLDQPELLGSTDDGDAAVIRLRYQFVGHLDPMARRLLGSGQLAWIQEVRVQRSTAAGTLGFEAEREPRRLHGAADFTLAPSAGGTIRRLEGELVVAVPGVGGLAERRIVPGLLRRLDPEAEAVDAALS